MARKLKSDKVLFIATLLLVALSVVMVYSASAPMALDRYGRATRFLTTQVMWSVLGIAMLTVVMRIDYRHYREPMFIWTGLALVCLRARLRLLPRAGQRRAPLVRHRRHRRPAVGAGQAGGDLLHRGAARTADAPHRRGHVCAAADRDRRARHGRVDPARARLRHLDGHPDHHRRHDLRGRPELALHRGPRAGRPPRDLHRRDGFGLSAAPHARVPPSLGRPARRRLPDHPVADRDRHRRRLGQGPDERRAEAVLPARSRTPTSSTRSSPRSSGWSAPPRW